MRPGYITFDESVTKKYQKIMQRHWREIRAGDLPRDKEEQKALILSSPNCVFPCIPGQIYEWRLTLDDVRRDDYFATWPGRWIGCTHEAGQELDSMYAYYNHSGDFERLTYVAACRKRFLNYFFVPPSMPAHRLDG